MICWVEIVDPTKPSFSRQGFKETTEVYIQVCLLHKQGILMCQGLHKALMEGSVKSQSRIETNIARFG